MKSAAIAFLLLVSSAASAATELPRVATDAAGAARLIVDGKPFTVLGGELGNSNASHVAVAKPLFAKLAAMKLNTVLVPVSWELVERVEGKYSFDLVGDLVREARRQKLRVVLLWFGSWKNGMSSYVPAWIKSNPERFPRAEVDGRPPRRGAVSVRARQRPGGRARVQRADALSARRRRPRPHRHHGAGRERGRDDRRGSPTAARSRRRRSPAPVPKELLARFPGKARGHLGAGVRARAGRRKRCSWRGTTPRYIEAVARAGKAAYPLPMLTNAALNRPGKQPGQYPSGGPLPHLFEAWKAGAPSLDLLAPDIYLPDFVDLVRSLPAAGQPAVHPRGEERRGRRGPRAVRDRSRARSASRRSRSSPRATRMRRR